MKLIKIGLIVLLILLIANQVDTNKRAQEDTNNTPIISSDVDEIQIPCQYNKEDLIQGLSAYDIEDGYITDKILVGGFSDFTERGVSSLDYAVYDKDNNVAIFNRKVVFSDYIPPKITILEPLVFRATTNAYITLSSYLEGSDVLDGDVSKHILITETDVDFSEPGSYTASVNLKNSFGDEVNMDLPIHIYDPAISGYTIELTKPMIYIDEGDDFDPEDYLVSIKNEYSNAVVPDDKYTLTIDSDVDTSEAGIYGVKFFATSSDEAQSGETWMTVVVGDYGG